MRGFAFDGIVRKLVALPPPTLPAHGRKASTVWVCLCVCVCVCVCVVEVCVCVCVVRAFDVGKLVELVALLQLPLDHEG